MLELSAVIQRHNTDKRRSHQIQEYHIENTSDAVQNDNHKIPEQLERYHEQQNKLNTAHIEVLRYIRIAVNTLITRIICTTQWIIHCSILVIDRVLCRTQRGHQEYHAVQRNAGIITAVLSRISLQRCKGRIGLQLLHAGQNSVRGCSVVNIKAHFIQIRCVYDLL